jgi:competence protein ComEC
MQEFCREDSSRMTQLSTPFTPAPSPRGRTFRHRPLLPVVLGLALAILIADRSANHIVWGCALCGVLAAACLGAARHWRKRRGILLAVAVALLLGYAFTLWSAVYLPADHISRHLVAHPVTLEGRLLRAEPASPGRTTLDIAAQTLRDTTDVKSVSGLVRVTAYDFEPAVRAGDLVRVQRLRLRQPNSFRNPGAFDYGRYLARRGVYATASLSTAERLEVVHRPPSRILAPLVRLKASLAGHMARVMAEPQAAITQGMVFGLRSRLTPEVQEAFAASGTAHLMSVSGLHVGFVYAAAFFLLKPCFVRIRFQVLGRLSGGPRPSKLTAAVSLLAVIGYACLVGPNFPTIRATLMIVTCQMYVPSRTILDNLV